MPTTIFYLSFLLLVLFPDVTSLEEVALLPGDIYIAGMFPVKTLENGVCRRVDVSFVEAVEAIKWTFQTLNDKDFIPGIKLGLVGYNTCGSDEKAMLLASQLTGNVTSNRSSRIVGLLGPGLNSEADAVSRFLSSLPYEDRLLQVGFSNGASTLSDRTAHSNFYRVVPSDDIQIQIMADLLTTMQWNYVAILYENNAVEKQNTAAFSAVVKSRRVCIPLIRSVNIGKNKDIDINDIRRFVQDVMVRKNGIIPVVIVFGGEDTARLLLQQTSTMHQSQSPVFVFSNAIGLGQRVFTDSQGVIAAAKGSLVVRATGWESELHFHHFWDRLAENISHNASLLHEQSLTNPWLWDAFCENGDRAECTGDRTVDSSVDVIVDHAIRAACALASVLKDVHEDICQGETGLCDQMKELGKGAYIDAAADTVVNVTSCLGEGYDDLFSFDPSTGNARENSLSEIYGIYNYQKESVSSIFELKKVGSYRNESLYFDKSQLKDYFYDGSERSDFRRGQCSEGQLCSECVYHSSLSRGLYFPGDVIVVAMVPIHNKGGQPLTCGTIRTTTGLEIAEGIFYEVRKINSQPNTYMNLFKNRTVGLIILDTCNDALVAQENILAAYNGHISTLPTNIKDKIVGFIGPLGSDITIEVARTLTILGVPQISYASVSDTLTDRNRFPFFMRVSTPCSKQAEAMISVIRLLLSNYIQVVYSLGEYGQSCFQALESAASENDICIAQVIRFADADNAYSVLDTLRAHPSAKMVVVFLRSHVAPHVMQAVSSRMDGSEFLFLGSDEWGRRDFIISNAANLAGSLTFSQEIGLTDGFEEFLATIEPSEHYYNPWLQSFMETRFNCYFPMSFNKTTARECTEMDRLGNHGDYKPDPWTAFAMAAVRSLLIGAHDVMKDVCGSDTPVCDEYRRRTSDVMKAVRNASVVRDNNDTKPLFDADGNGQLGYKIYVIQRIKGTRNMIYQSVGHWKSPDDSMFDLTLLPSVSALQSVVPNEKERGVCFKTKSAPEEESLDGPDVGKAFLITFVLILLIAIGTMIMMFWRRYKQLKTELQDEKLKPQGIKYVASCAYIDVFPDPVYDWIELDEKDEKKDDENGSEREEHDGNEYVRSGTFLSDFM